MNFVRLSVSAGLLVASAVCAQSAPSSPRPTETPRLAASAKSLPSAPDAGPAREQATVESDPLLAPLLRPASLPCPATFPRGYRFIGASPAEVDTLFRLIWKDNRSRGEYVAPTSPEGRDAEAARCIAIGPHRDFNMLNWCCR